MKGGRPLRFLMMVVAGWTSLRVVMLWPTIDSPAALIDAIIPSASASAGPAIVADLSHKLAVERPSTAPFAIAEQLSGNPFAIALETMLHIRQAIPAEQEETGQRRSENPSLPPPLRPVPYAKSASRLSGSAWLIARDGGGSSAVPGSQLGGSQAGVRLAYAVGQARRLAIVARATAPLQGHGREASLGIEWRLANALRLVAEQRIALEAGGRGGPTLGVIAGSGPTPIGAGFRLETYGQAGIIARDGGEAYADGAARVFRPIVEIGGTRIDLGAGVWGGAQRGASRLDIGPSIGVALPVGARRLRATLDWRQRVAGTARPPSGPALSLGTDF